jgi:site-specific DNA-cytosine methylase
MKVPEHIRTHLEQWGLAMKAAVCDARHKFLQQHQMTGGSLQTVTHQIATDCSGLEAPIAALDSLGLSYRHIWSCDRSRAAQKWIARNYNPEHFYEDCLARDLSPLLTRAGAVTGYLAGFPCQPFSKLNNSRKYFKDSRCKVFNAVLETANACLPLWCVLENVKDILRFQRQLQSRFKKFLHNQYTVICIPLCPSTLLHEPVERPRCWFILIRQDVILSHDMEQMRCLVEHLLNSLVPKLQPKHLAQRLLPAVSSPPKSSVQNRPPRKVAKWIVKHKDIRQKLGLQQPSHSNLIPTGTARENDLLALVMQSQPKSSGTLVVDVSQSAGRTPIRLNLCPTIASSSRVVVLGKDGQNRMLTALDKLALHWFPIHKLEVPHTVSDHEMSELTGNTQHVGTCAVALLVAMSLINWSKQASSRQDLAKLAASSQVSQHLHVWRWEDGELKAARNKAHKPVKKRGSTNLGKTATSRTNRPGTGSSSSSRKRSSKQSQLVRGRADKTAGSVSTRTSSLRKPLLQRPLPDSTNKTSTFAQLFR